MSYTPDYAYQIPRLDTNLVNNSGSTITAAKPVRIDSNGDIGTIDVSIESQALAIVGLTINTVNNSSTGTIVNSGRLDNVASLGFNSGAVLYVSKAGGLTDVRPDVGSNGFLSGDFCIKIGVVAKSQTNPAEKDLILNITIVGQL